MRGNGARRTSHLPHEIIEVWGTPFACQTALSSWLFYCDGRDARDACRDGTGRGFGELKLATQPVPYTHTHNNTFVASKLGVIYYSETGPTCGRYVLFRFGCILGSTLNWLYLMRVMPSLKLP